MPSSTAAIRRGSPAAATLPSQPPARGSRVTSIDTGDHRAKVRERRDRLVEDHAGIVRGIAERVKAVAPASVELDDLIQTGMIALLHAATRYRPEAFGGAPFSAYARKVVRGAMLDSISGRRYREEKLIHFGDVDGMQNAEPSMAPTADEAIDDRRLAARIEDAITYLDGPSRRLIRSYYRDGGTLEDAGEELGIDRRRAGELHARAIARLKQIVHA